MQQRKSRITSLLGMAMKAGKISSGEFKTMDAVKSGESFLVIVAEDASENTKKKFRDKCAYRDIPCMCYADRDILGACIGRQFRACLSVNDRGFAEAIVRAVREEEGNVRSSF